jgi:hypothetical protein
MRGITNDINIKLLINFHSPITVFCPENAAFVAVSSAFPRLVRGKLGSLEALMVLLVHLTTTSCLE